MGIVWTIVIGFVAGLVARALMPGPNPLGFILTSALGVAGSMIATYLGQSMGWYRAGQGAGFVASVGGALILLFVFGLVSAQELRHAHGGARASHARGGLNAAGRRPAPRRRRGLVAPARGRPRLRAAGRRRRGGARPGTPAAPTLPGRPPPAARAP